MITDEERREVARRLRGIDAERLDRVYGMDGEGGECSDPDTAKAGRNLMLGAIAEAVGLHFAPYYFDASPLRDRLADLIEPGEPKVKCVAEVKIDGEQLEKLVHEAVVEYAGVDRDALLALADGMDHPIRQAVWNQTSGVRREHIMAEYARRIREACGEVKSCDAQS